MARVFTTLTDLESSSSPTLRLQLTNSARELGSSRPSQPILLANFRRMFTNLVCENGNIDFEEDRSESARKRNEAKLDVIFDDMVKELEKGRTDARESLRNLTPEQQEDVLMFWALAQNFFADVMKWMQDIFQTVLEKIRQGYRLVKKVVKEIFDTIEGWLNNIF